jgi:hypothetical protein
VTVTLVEYQGGRQVDTMVMTSYARRREAGGQFATLVAFQQPARDAGKLMLKNGSELWFYDPASKASIRLSPQQRLLGQAANGDVVTVDLARDYRAELAGEEEIQDGERKQRATRKLLLHAVADDVTYPRIELWVDAADARPIKGRFFTESGHLLKTVFYRRYQRELGIDRPTEMVIIDGLNPRSVTVMRFANFTRKTIPDLWLQRDHLPRFQPE